MLQINLILEYSKDNEQEKIYFKLLVYRDFIVELIAFLCKISKIFMT